MGRLERVVEERERRHDVGGLSISRWRVPVWRASEGTSRAGSKSEIAPTSLGAAEIIFLSGLVRWPRMLSGGLGLLTGPD